jgi:eukaryotic-like serine/threonine-protein kinase
MTPERWAQIEELFHRVAECDPAQRASLLDGSCSGDADLRLEVEALLLNERSAGDHLQAAVRVGLDAVAYPLVGETISHYRVLDGLGSGGMGLVYCAQDAKLGRRVALKFLPEESSKDPAALERFEREARSASALEHPNICPIYEFGEHQGRPFLVMQLLEGQTLRELITANNDEPAPLGLRKVVDLGLQIAGGLEAAHRHGIIHRDIKPANIFVTSQGQAKILDFGLAKLTSGATAVEKDSQQNPRDAVGIAAAPQPRAVDPTPDPLLSRTGVAMGTAAYMSPEQARGEKLDARTDLYSFGLVLHEMATGQRALNGAERPESPNSILPHAPTTTRQTNPKLPAKFQQILDRALQRDRQIRYQSADEMRADLAAVQRDLEEKPTSHWQRWAVGAGCAVVIALAALWFATNKPQSPPLLPDAKLRQLTINSSENPVSSSAISPSGKYLAYVDPQGIHVKDIDTGMTHLVAAPQEMLAANLAWEIIDSGWFPDNSRFLVDSHPASQAAGIDWSSRTTDIWIFSRMMDPPRKLCEHATAWSVSPDGSTVAYGTHAGKFGDREAWLVNSDGQQPRQIISVDENDSLSGLLWSPDAQRSIYFTTDASGDTLWTRDMRSGAALTVVNASQTKGFHGDISWLPDGRVVYQVSSAPAEFTDPRDDCDFWSMRVDVHSGKLTDKPKRLTNWPGFCIWNANVTADGKRLVFLRGSSHSTIHVADLDASGARLRNLRHFTLDESINFTQDWTNDSSSVIFTSNRSGKFGLYKQSLQADHPELLTLTSLRDTPATPDGNWILGFTYPRSSDPKIPDQLLRIPLAGGEPEPLTTVLPESAVFCARPPVNLCVLAEQIEDRTVTIFSSLDVLHGRGRELARIPSDPNIGYWDFDLSPDGTLLAVSGNPDGPIHILSLRREPERQLHSTLRNVQEFHWAADSNGLYVPTHSPDGAKLFYLDLGGNARLLWEARGANWSWARPSPDGRHLAISSVSNSNNVWMMENF